MLNHALIAVLCLLIAFCGEPPKHLDNPHTPEAGYSVFNPP
jgi:hypothetical protein